MRVLGGSGRYRLGRPSSTRAAPFWTRPSSALYALARARPALRAMAYPVLGPLRSKTSYTRLSVGVKPKPVRSRVAIIAELGRPPSHELHRPAQQLGDLGQAEGHVDHPAFGGLGLGIQ